MTAVLTREFFYLLLVVLSITATSLIAKLASSRNIRPLDLSTALFVMSSLLGAAVLWPKFPFSFNLHALLFAALGGIGGSGAVLAFNHAIRLGHFGFSNAIYRSSFLIPVGFSVLFLGAPLKSTTIAGMFLILAGMYLMSWSTGGTESSHRPNLRWVGLIVLAFLLSGAPRVGQLLTTTYKQDYLLYLFLSYLIGSVVLVGANICQQSFQFRAISWGSGAALSSYLGVFCTLKALEQLNAQVVFPISLAGPIILGLVLSLFLFREKTTPKGWMGAILGLLGILILSVWK